MVEESVIWHKCNWEGNSRYKECLSEQKHFDSKKCFVMKENEPCRKRLKMQWKKEENGGKA